MRISKPEFIHLITSTPHMFCTAIYGNRLDNDTINAYLKTVSGCALAIPRTVDTVYSERIAFSDGSNLLTHSGKTYHKYESSESDHILLEVAYGNRYIYYDLIPKEGDRA